MKYSFMCLGRAFLVLALIPSCSVKAAMDYNGNPINRGGTFTITPQTSSAALAGYTQSINTDGLLDYTFGSLGKVISVLGTTTVAKAVALQADGKIVIV